VRLNAGPGITPYLIIGIGNPSRGDDAIGPVAISQLEALGLPGTELLTDFQLQVEHALDLIGRREVVFIDATASGEAPYHFEPAHPVADASATTHALSPAAVLEAFRRVTGEPPPPAFVLAVRGYAFDLGAPMSAAAARNLDAALQMLKTRFRGTL
jgi:hydrogenase maturation protease